MRAEDYIPSPVVAELYRMYPDPMATQAAKGLVEGLPPPVASRWRHPTVMLLLVFRLPVRWLMLSLRGLLKRPSPFSVPPGYVLFLPNIGGNLPGMAGVARALGEAPRVYCCPDNLSPAEILGSLGERGREGTWLFRFSWKHYVRLSRLPAYIGFARCLAACYGDRGGPLPEVVKRISDAALYGIACRDLSDLVFSRVLAAPPAVIVSARPKSEYANLPFLDGGRRAAIPTYHLAHTHISRSRWFQYQVFQGDLFAGHFLFSHCCARLARESFAVSGELIVVGDPTLDSSPTLPKRMAVSSQHLRVLFAASSDYGQQSMRDTVEACSGLENIVLHIKARPPGNNTHAVYQLLAGCELDGVEVLDHAEVGSIENILSDYDLVIGSVSNGILSAVVRGLPAISYIAASDWQDIRERGMFPLPYAEFGVSVVSNRVELEQILTSCVDARSRKALYLAQRKRLEAMYPNLSGVPASEAICARLKQHLAPCLP